MVGFPGGISDRSFLVVDSIVIYGDYAMRIVYEYASIAQPKTSVDTRTLHSSS